MQLYLNGQLDNSLSQEIRSEAGRFEQTATLADAAPVASLLNTPSEGDFAEKFSAALHHYTAIPYPRAEQLAVGTPRHNRNPAQRLFGKLADRLLHARILPLWRWLLWRQTSLNRTLADGVRFERQRAQQRETELTDRIDQLEATLAQLTPSAPAQPKRGES